MWRPETYNILNFNYLMNLEPGGSDEDRFNPESAPLY